MKVFLRRSGKLTLVFLSLVVLFVMSGVNPAECRPFSLEDVKDIESIYNILNGTRQSETRNVLSNLQPNALENPIATSININKGNISNENKGNTSEVGTSNIDIIIPQSPFQNLVFDDQTPTPTPIAMPVGNTGLPQKTTHDELQELLKEPSDSHFDNYDDWWRPKTDWQNESRKRLDDLKKIMDDGVDAGEGFTLFTESNPLVSSAANDDDDSQLEPGVYAEGLPEGLFVSNDGYIYGSSRQAGNYTVKVKVKYDNGNILRRTLNVSIPDVPPSEWECSYSPADISNLKIGDKFTAMYRVMRGTNVSYDVTDMGDFDSYRVHFDTEEREGYVRFYGTYNGSSEYKAQVKASNTAGEVLSPAGITLKGTPSTEHSEAIDEVTKRIGNFEGSNAETVMKLLDTLSEDEALKVTRIEMKDYHKDSDDFYLLNAFVNLREISLKDCDKLTTILIEADMKNLRELCVWNCLAIEEVDVSKLPALRNLEVVECGIVESDDTTPITVYAEDCPELLSVILSRSDMFDFYGAGSNKIEEIEAGGSEICDIYLDGSDNLKRLDLAMALLTKGEGDFNINEFHGLTRINMNQSMISIDVQSFKELEYLYFIDELVSGDMKYDFTGMNKLKELDLSYSRIYDLNVSGLKNLRTLKLYNCYKIDQLTIKDCPNLKEIDFSFALPYFVDFSGLTSLEKVTAQHSEYLLDVNLTGCTNLRELDLSEANLLPALDLSDCMKLERLDVDSTLLTSLDVSGHKNLRWLDAGRCLILKVINCSGCALEYLNLLFDYSLEEVYCSGNNLDQIKVVNLSSLKTLDCKNNNMTFLNLDDFMTLENLECSGQVLNKKYWKTGTTVDMGLYVGKYAITLTNSSGDVLLETTTLKKIIDVQGYDSNGKEIETSYDAETGFATFSTAPDRIEYIYDTGRDSNLSVTLASKTDYEPSESESRLSGSSGGCNSYRSISGILALLLFAWKYSGIIKRTH